jgi:hypothetical protein
LSESYAIEDFGVAFFVAGAARHGVREMGYALGDGLAWRLEVLDCFCGSFVDGSISGFSIFVR